MKKGRPAARGNTRKPMSQKPKARPGSIDPNDEGMVREQALRDEERRHFWLDDAADAADTEKNEKDGERARDITTGQSLLDAYQFRREDFALNNVDAVTEYADYRVQGFSAEVAFVRVFGTDYADFYLTHRIDALEQNAVYRRIFATQFARVPVDRMFSLKEAVHEWKSLLNNPFTKCSTKATALKELAVIYKLTEVDAQGRTKAGKGLHEFYETIPRAVTVAEGSESNSHPAPGSEEAEAFLSEGRDGEQEAARD